VTESLVFLVMMLGLIVVGTTIVVLRAREPKGEYRGIKSFQREMQALAPDGARVTGTDAGVRPVGLDPLLPGLVVSLGDDAGAAAPERQE
jgi:hypothetical protein